MSYAEQDNQGNIIVSHDINGEHEIELWSSWKD